jgi:glycosyltransferase involved in cell wall biosynthesis
VRTLLFFESDSGRGGGFIAVQRLHLGLRKAGIDSKIFCKSKKTQSNDTLAFPQNSILTRIEGRLGPITKRFGFNDIHNLNTFKIRKSRAFQDADVIDFHGTHGGFFNWAALPSLTASKPAVLTLHDMWALTGHCAFSFDCERWKTGCGKCPYPGTDPPISRDSTHLEWRFKNWVYAHSKLALVTTSRWLTDLVQQSMLNRFPIHQIPYGIDTQVYRPLDRNQCRSVLGIPPAKRVLMFAAMSMDFSHSQGHRKGGDLLLKALEGLPNSLKAETLLLLVGEGGEALASAVGIGTLNLGYVASDHLKAIAYSAADLFLFPTRADSFGIVSIESQACGTPVVSFRVGGVPDHVRPGITGYLAEPENTGEFRSGIVELLEDSSLRKRLSEQCRSVAVEEYSLDLQVRRYIHLYATMLGTTDGIEKAGSNPPTSSAAGGRLAS